MPVIKAVFAIAVEKSMVSPSGIARAKVECE
jgi:hypothetical protein